MCWAPVDRTIFASRNQHWLHRTNCTRRPSESGSNKSIDMICQGLSEAALMSVDRVYCSCLAFTATSHLKVFTLKKIEVYTQRSMEYCLDL